MFDTYIRNITIAMLEKTKVMYVMERFLFDPLRTEELSTVGKIYAPIFSFFRKSVVNITILDLRPVSNKSPGNFKFYI